MESKERRASPATLSPKWPDQPSTNPAGEAARRFAVNLRAAIGDKPVRAVAREAGGLAPAPWTRAVPALPTEWLWDGDDTASPEFRTLIRQQTPPLFLAKGILLRDRDVRIL